MPTIPDELIDSARIDGATDWRIYWQIILPLAAPALAVLAMTVPTLLPIMIVFAFLQKYITTGIATTGMK